MSCGNLVVALLVCFSGIVAANPSFIPSFIYPVEHRSDLKTLQDQAASQGYELQVVPNDAESAVIEYDPSSVSLLSLVWDFLPSPITAVKTVIKAIASKIWKIAKFIMPVNLILLGMGLVIGFCAFTSHCTMIIEEPLSSKILAIKESIPYIDDIEYYVYEAIDKVQALQS